ncbi:MAG: lipid-binding protein [Deltaproteobacteria bacterium]|jgi:polyisoprenoid-binding protein YceI|nr:lipid-binding protein [Deltaproteobacteria bacterium]|tara:strand:- start:114 stop:656 length:543 start_codon:yes stop_codon:yes gene_type:complete
MKILLFLASLLSSSAMAAEIDTDRSVFNWKGSKITGSFHEGQLFPLSSSITIEDDKITGGEIVINMLTFTVTDIVDKERAPKFLRHMKSADFFNVEKFSTASLKLLSIENDTAVGNLTVLGKTQTVSFPIKKEGEKYVGKMTFDRTKFGITYKSGNFFTDLGDKVINDEIEVTFEIFIKG